MTSLWSFAGLENGILYMTSTSFNREPPILFVFKFSYIDEPVTSLPVCNHLPLSPKATMESDVLSNNDLWLHNVTTNGLFSVDSCRFHKEIFHSPQWSFSSLPPKTAKRMPPCHSDFKHRCHCILKRQTLKKRKTIRTTKKKSCSSFFFQCSFGFLLLFSPAPCFFILSIYILHSLCQYFNSGANWLWLMLDRENAQHGCQFFFLLFLLKLLNHYASFPSFTSTSGATEFHVQAIHHYLLPNGQLAAIFLICTRWLHNIKIG